MEQRKNIIFKAMYWSYEDTEENTLIIHVSGMTEFQQTVQLQVEKFTPYVYLQLPLRSPQGGNWTNDKCKKLFEYFKSNMGVKAPLTYKMKKKQILHFREEGIFMFLTFPTNKACIEFERKCSGKNFIPGVGMINSGVFKVHEHNIDPILKFTAMKKLLLAGWLCCTKELIKDDEIGLSDEERKFSTADIDFYSHYKNINPYEMKKTVILHPPYCSFDIECNSQNHNSKLPDPENPENEVFQISAIFGKMNLPEQEVYLLSRFDPLDIEDSKVIRFKTEKDLLLYFAKLIRTKDPLFIKSYNGMKFDWTYMIKRAEKFGYLPKFLDISRIIGKKALLKKVNWSSSAYGEQEFLYPDCFGRIQIDVILEIERNYRLPSYSLNNVAEKFLGECKDDITPRQLFMFYKITKDLLHVARRSDIDVQNVQKEIKHILPFRKTHGVVRRHRRKMLNCKSQEELVLLIRECLTMTLRYCRQDTVLPIRLVEKLNLLTTMEEMSNVMHVPMSYLHTRGQQIKVLAQIFRETIGENLVIPHNKKDPNKPKENYEGAIVVEAHAGDYDNVGTLDFCLTGDTLISTGNGVSIPLKDITKDNKVIGWNGESFGEYSHLGVVHKGKKETVKVWLCDGSTVKCTPDHKFMLDNGEWCRADELVGKYVKCGFDQPCDIKCEKEKDWKLVMKNLTLTMNENREKCLAFARIIGYVLSDGSIYETTDKKGRIRQCCEVSMGTMIDAKDIMKDIVLVGCKEVTIRKRSRGVKGTTYCITIPAFLAKNIHSLENIVVGKRATQPMKLPSFILDEDCPLSIIREFLAGLFGGDAAAPYYQKRRHSSFGHMSFKWTTIEKYKNEMIIVFEQIQSLLLKFNVFSSRLETKVKYGENSIKPKNIEEDNCRWDIFIDFSIDNITPYQEKIGFRYCINKCAKLTIASSYYKMKEKIREQNSRIVNFTSEIYSKKISAAKALETAKIKIFSHEPPLDDLSLSSVDDFHLRKKGNTKMRIEHLTTTWFLQETQSEDLFSSGVAACYKKHAVSSDSLLIPSFRKKVIGVFDNGIEDVYDVFNVENVHNYLAGGVQVSNCSLYPTTMIAFNICYTTLVKDENIPDEQCHVLEWSSHVGCPHDPLKRKKKKDDRDIMVCGDYKCRFLKVKYSYDEENGVIIRENEGVMPRLERNLLTSRKEVKKEMFKAESRLNMNRGECTAEDIAFFKKCGFEIIEPGSLSKEEDKILETVVGILNAKQLAIKVSANSCTENTPILCLIDGKIEYKCIEELFIEKSFCDEKGNEFCKYDGLKNIKVWSDEGWADVKYVFRHSVNPEDCIFEIQTLTGCVEVTEDHSLLDGFGEKIRYEELHKNQELLSVDLPLPKDTPNEFLYCCENFTEEEFLVFENGKNVIEKSISNDLLNAPYKIRYAFISGCCSIFTRGFIKIESKLEAAKLYFLLESVGFKVSILCEESAYILNFGETNKLPSYFIGAKKVERYGKYVYDIETSTHHFAAGIGDLIVHNSAYGALGAGDGFVPLIQGAASVTAMGRKLITLAVQKIKKEWSNCKLIYGDTDSCMIFFEDCSLKECFENCEKASRVVTHFLKTWILGVDENYKVKVKNETIPLNKLTSKSELFKELSYEHKIKVIEYESIPTDLTFEKVYGRFLLLTKKRYIAYTVNKDGKIIETTKKGVVLTRRDNSQSLRTTYKKVSDGILDRKDEKEVMYELYDEIHKLFTRQVPETNFIIYLGVKKIIDYAKKKRFEIGGKYETFFVDEKGRPIEDPVGPLDPRLLYPNLPQVLLSLKLLNRGTDVPANTRLEHIYIENKNATHQGQKAEDYTYYKENKDVEGFKIDYLHYLEKLQAPISELIRVKYPKKDIVLYEKLEDAVKRILSINNIEEYKRVTLSRVSKFVKTVEQYDKWEVGWCVLKKGQIKKFINKKELEYPRNNGGCMVYEFKGVNAKIEHILQSSKGTNINDFTIDNPVEKEMIDISKTYKSRVIIDSLHSQYKVKKRSFKKPTQTGEKLIKNTRVRIKDGVYEGRYGKIHDLREIESNTKKKKYIFSVLLDETKEIVEDISRNCLVTYRFRDDNVMKDIYNYRCFYKNVVEELNTLFNPVVFLD